jgi:hypothetical protein
MTMIDLFCTSLISRMIQLPYTYLIAYGIRRDALCVLSSPATITRENARGDNQQQQQQQ